MSHCYYTPNSMRYVLGCWRGFVGDVGFLMEAHFSPTALLLTRATLEVFGYHPWEFLFKSSDHFVHLVCILTLEDIF